MDTAQSTINNDIDRTDRYTSNKSIYEASAGEVFWKNFLAGFGRALGGLFLYGVFIGVTAYIFVSQALPHITPFITEYQQAVQSLNQVGKTSTGSLQQSKQLLQDLPVTPSK